MSVTVWFIEDLMLAFWEKKFPAGKCTLANFCFFFPFIHFLLSSTVTLGLAPSQLDEVCISLIFIFSTIYIHFLPYPFPLQVAVLENVNSGWRLNLWMSGGADSQADRFSLPTLLIARWGHRARSNWSAGSDLLGNLIPKALQKSKRGVVCVFVMPEHQTFFL